MGGDVREGRAKHNHGLGGWDGWEKRERQEKRRGSCPQIAQMVADGGGILNIARSSLDPTSSGRIAFGGRSLREAGEMG